VVLDKSNRIHCLTFRRSALKRIKSLLHIWAKRS